MKLFNSLKTLSIVLIFKNFIVMPFLFANKLSFQIKISHILITSILLSPLAWFNDLLRMHVILSPSFVRVLLILLTVDILLGAMKHGKLRSFDWSELFKGAGTKTAVTFLGMTVFNALASIEEVTTIGGGGRDYLILVGKICNALYLAGSAFNSTYIITNGKFPPTAWMKRMKKFGTSLNLKDLQQDGTNVDIAALEKEDREFLDSILKADNRDNALNMLQKFTAARSKVVTKFKAGGQDVPFDSVASLGSEFVEIEKGVTARVVKVIGSTHFVLECIMTKGAELALHKHSDYEESFELREGGLFDKVSNTLIESTATFKAGEWHQLVALHDSEMIINCIKK